MQKNKVFLIKTDIEYSGWITISYTGAKGSMNAPEKNAKKYNVILAKLFQVVINLDEEQQQTLLRHAEELLVREKRGGFRAPCRIPINYAAYDRLYTNYIKNISPSGLFIQTQRPLLVGDEIIMTFRLESDEKPLKLKGEIARADRDGVGVEFKDISPEAEEMLRALLQQL